MGTFILTHTHRTHINTRVGVGMECGVGCLRSCRRNSLDAAGRTELGAWLERGLRRDDQFPPALQFPSSTRLRDQIGLTAATTRPSAIFHTQHVHVTRDRTASRRVYIVVYVMLKTSPGMSCSWPRRLIRVIRVIRAVGRAACIVACACVVRMYIYVLPVNKIFVYTEIEMMSNS